MPPPRGCDVTISTSFTTRPARVPQREPKADSDKDKDKEWKKRIVDEKRGDKALRAAFEFAG